MAVLGVLGQLGLLVLDTAVVVVDVGIPDIDVDVDLVAVDAVGVLKLEVMLGVEVVVVGKMVWIQTSTTLPCCHEQFICCRHFDSLTLRVFMNKMLLTI